MIPGSGNIVFDEPLVGADIRPVKTAETLKAIARDASEEVIIVTAYFVPEDDFYDTVRELTGRGVQVKILTNSLGSNNHAVAHSGYKPKRRRVLQAGAELFELRHDAAIKAIADTSPVTARYVGLHAKAIIVDRHRVFVGTLNFDPRSIYLNTEMGLLVDNAMLGTALAEKFDQDMRGENAWRVSVDEEGHLRWESSDGTVTRQPARHGGERFAAWFFGLLPLESQL